MEKMMKKSLKQKGIAVFLVLLVGMVLAVGTVNAQENIKESGTGEEIAVSNSEINMPLKPVFDLTAEQVTELTEKGIIKDYPDGTRGINLYEALKEIKGNQSLTTSDIKAEIKAGEYRHALMRTWHPSDQYRYRGHKYYVKIPANVNLNPATSFNIYSTHLVRSNEDDFLEVGVGWFQGSKERSVWGTGGGLNLFAYNSRDGYLCFRSIPSGVSRDIFLRVHVRYDGQYVGYLYASDPYSGNTINWPVHGWYGLDHRITESQEQHSSSQVWTSTPQAKRHDHIIKNRNDQWVDWNMPWPTTQFWVESPLKQTNGKENNRWYTKSWCEV
ncbi:MAG TPA: hypothetical protein HA348_06250 [Thermoplasmata archaeon]|mgnify:CR=1 FL=1|nr:hypothetical protein [Thermoplasmata archaeon]